MLHPGVAGCDRAHFFAVVPFRRTALHRLAVEHAGRDAVDPCQQDGYSPLRPFSHLVPPARLNWLRLKAMMTVNFAPRRALARQAVLRRACPGREAALHNLRANTVRYVVNGAVIRWIKHSRIPSEAG